MFYKDFSDLDISTITSVCSLNKEIKHKIFFVLMPAFYGEKETEFISMDCEGLHKGIQNKEKKYKNFFKHCIELYFKAEKKCVNIKINKKGFHLTGAKSKKDVEYSFNKIVEQINFYNNKIKYMNDNPLEKKKVLKWFLKNLKGEKVKRKEEILFYEDEKTKFYEKKEVDDHLINIEAFYEKKHDDLNPTIFNLFKDSIQEEIHNNNKFFYSTIKNKIKCVSKFKNIFSGKTPLKLNNIKISMCNYNYNVGFKIYRSKINELFKDINIVRTDDRSIKSVTIESFFNKDLNPFVTIRFFVNKEGKIKKHSLLIYKTGSITQSGPGDDDMEFFYNFFMNFLSKNKNVIKWDK